jgi:hypothetical protein
MGEKTGVIVLPMALRMDLSLSSLPKEPSVPTAFRKLRITTMGR